MMASRSSRDFFRLIFAGLFLISFLSTNAAADDKEKKPLITQYWMDVATQNMSIPGMSEELSGFGGMMGKMTKKPGFGPKRNLLLRLDSPKALPRDPSATHDIPPGQKMGDTLPLIIPERAVTKSEHSEDSAEQRKIDKPKARMLIYWGCSEEVGKGQPRVIDTEKMSVEEFGKAFMTGHTPSPQYPPRPRAGWIYADWPNRKNSTEVPADGSLKGDHFIHGNYTSDIKFSIDDTHDFMAPVEFTHIQGTTLESIRFEWKGIPTATGYFATAMAHDEKTGETIFWSSSEVPETGFALMDYLSNKDVSKFIREKVVMNPKITSCNIPKGIFRDAAGMLQFIAYGDELNVVFPPKPKDPKQAWNPIWSVKERLKSTGMTALGQGEGKRVGRQREKVREEEQSSESSESKQQEPEKKPEESPLKKLRKGFLGF